MIYWTPVIAPGNLMFYWGSLFPSWKGSAFTGGLVTNTLSRIIIDGVRDVEEAPNGALWLLEDASPGGLYRLTPKWPSSRNDVQ